MRFFYLLTGLLLSLAAYAGNNPGHQPESWLRFIRNDRQWDQKILYRADIPGGYLFVRAHSLQYVFYDTEAVRAWHAAKAQPAARRSANAPRPPQSATLRAHGFTVEFVGAQTEPDIEALQPTPDKRNYFIGSDPARWATNVPAFGEIIYHDLYPGVDLRMYNASNSLKYELLVAPGADAGRIQLRYTGMDDLSLQQERLVIRTSLNTVQETKPYCYQPILESNREVASHFVLKENTVSFRFPKGYQSKYPLVIDPALVFATFSGSVSDNWGQCATYDAQGNLYSGGSVFGNSFPATNGAFQVRYGSGQDTTNLTDVAILKYNPTGTQLLYATYLGGGQSEVPHSLFVNSAGELIIMGSTSSTDFPTSANGYDRSYNGGTRLPDLYGTPSSILSGISYPNGSDLFVSKISPDGSRLVGSTFIGGSGNDGIRDPSDNIIRNYGDQFRSEVITDAADNVYVASFTASANFPLRNPVQASLRGSSDAVIFRLSPDLANLQWSTYLGGNATEAAHSLHVSPKGNVYVCGMTTSTDLPTRAGAFKALTLDTEDGFVAKFRGDQLLQLTYLGTQQADQAFLLDLDADENVHVLGLTTGDYPVTAGVYQNAGSRQFIHALDSTLARTVFSTVIGSGRITPDITPTAFLVNSCGNIYLAGWGSDVNNEVGNYNSNTSNLPVTAGAYRTTTNGDDFYLMMLEQGAKSLLYGTFIGSQRYESLSYGRNHVDGGTSRFTKEGVIYHAACACGGSGFPSTPGVWSRANNSGNCNNAAFKFDIESLRAGFDIFDNKGQKAVTTVCAPFPARFVNTSVGGVTYEWDLGGLATSNSAGDVTYTFDQPGEYTILLKAFNPITCQRVDSAQQTIRVLATDFQVSPEQQICQGQSVVLYAAGGSRYQWSPAAGLSDPTSPTPLASPEVTTRYTVTIINDNGCTTEKAVLVNVESVSAEDFKVTLSSECGRPLAVSFVNNIPDGEGYLWAMGNGDTLRGVTPEDYIYKVAGTYEVTLIVNRNGCVHMLSQKIKVDQMEDPPNVITPNGDGQNDTFFLKLRTEGPGKVPAEGYKLEIYNRWGRPVYQSESYLNDWGMGVANGLYYYLLTSPLGTTCKGWLQVLR